MDCKIIALCGALVFGSAQAAGNLQPRDINGDGIVDAYYDPAQNITFTADANLPAAFGLDDAFFGHAPGNLSHAHAEAWPLTLDLYGVTGWRLAKALTFNCTPNEDPTEPLPVFCRVATSELSLLPTFSVFRNVQDGYWIDGLLPPSSTNFGRLLLFAPGHGHNSDSQGDIPEGAWAVHDGDIAALATPVPEPETWALMLLGLMAFRLGGPGQRPGSRRTRTLRCLERPGCAAPRPMR